MKDILLGPLIHWFYYILSVVFQIKSDRRFFFGLAWLPLPLLGLNHFAFLHRANVFVYV